MAYGLRPANTAGAGYHTGGFVEYKIGTLGTAIFNGSCVTMPQLRVFSSELDGLTLKARSNLVNTTTV